MKCERLLRNDIILNDGYQDMYSIINQDKETI